MSPVPQPSVHSSYCAPASDPGAARDARDRRTWRIPVVFRQQQLPDGAYRRRHDALRAVLLVHVLGLAAYAGLQGAWHVYAELAPLVILLMLASSRLSLRLRASAVALGLYGSSAVIVHLSGGVIEAHFHFFVVLAMISLYRDFVPYLMGIGFVLIEHFVVGLLAPAAVFGHSNQTLMWASIHAGFVAAASLAHIVSWRAVEQVWADQRQTLADEVQRLAAVVDSAGVAIFSTDLDGVIVTWNNAAAVLFGFRPEEILGQPMSRLMTHGQTDQTAADMACVRNAESRSYEAQYSTSGGESLDVSLLVSPVRLADERVTGASVLARDVTDRRRAEQMLAARQEELARQAAALGLMAFQDPLTGLGNRAQIALDLRAALVQDLSSAPASGCAVLLLDLDGFKHINDSLGHAVGDRLLVVVADRLRLLLSAGASAGRLGGDEFVLVVSRTDAAAAAQLAAGVLAVLEEPIQVDGSELAISGSIGVAMSDDVSHFEQLLGAADIAMYSAKQRGRGGLAVFEPEMQQQADDRLSLEIDLRRAVIDEQLHLAYQPVVDLMTGSLAGVEALVRWSDPARGPVSPAEFIPVAEQTGLILPLGEWVLRQAVAQMKLWNAEAPTVGLVLNVNVSTRQLERPGFLAVIDDLLAHGLNPATLILEITETALARDGDSVIATLNALNERGIRLALDDFGTGYSSLSRLNAAPVSHLKLDQSFVNLIDDRVQMVPIVDATVALADGLGLGVIAEGVETPAQLQYLRRLGCAHAQGYLLARPQDADTISSMLSGELPWAGLLTAAAPGAAEDAASGPLLPTSVTRTTGHEEIGLPLSPAAVVTAAEAIAALAAAEVTADAAATAHAAVTVACAAALTAAAKAERVAVQAADAAAEAARALAAAGNPPHPRQQSDAAASLPALFAGDRYTAEDAAREVAASRTAEAAASAVLKVAARVESVAADVAAASARAAGLIELRLAEDAVAAACTVARSPLPPTAADPALEQRPEPGLGARTPQRPYGQDVAAKGQGHRASPRAHDFRSVHPEIDLMIHEMTVAGASSSTIAARLNQLGERTPLGVRWHATSVQATHLLDVKRRATDV